MKKLKVVINPASAIQSTEAGDPVWPVFSERELNLLGGICNLYGGEIEITSELPCQPVSGNEFVASFGDNLYEEGRLYAHLTRRSSINLRSFPELRNLKSPPAILIVSYEDLDASLLDFLYDGQSILSPGLIISYKTKVLRKQILAKSAAAFLSRQSANNSAMDFFPTSSINKFSHGNYDLLGNSAHKSSLRKLLSKPKSLLNIFTHSDGIDAYMGKLTLCPFAEQNINHLQQPPLCISTETCYRTGFSIREARANNMFLAVKEIQSNILFFLTCRGIRLQPSMINPLFGLGPQFVDNGLIGAYITSWKIQFFNPETVFRFSKYLHRHKYIGKAVAAFNKSAASRKAGVKVCLAGDPGTYFPGNANMQLANYLISGAMKTDQNGRHKPGSSSFLGFYLNILKSKASKTESSTIDDVLDLLDCHRSSQHKKVNHDQLTGSGKIIRERLLNILQTQEKEAVVDYVPYANEVMKSSAQEKCFICAAKTDTYYLRFNEVARYRRIVHICPNCGIIADHDKDSVRLQIHIAKHVFYLGGEGVPFKNWNACLLVQYKIEDLNFSHRWAVGRNGSPAKSFAFPPSLHEGPAYVTLFFMHGLNLSIVRQPYYVRRNYPANNS